MNKSYLLVICLLAASFTGCLGSDDIVDEVPVEEETIEPVGTGDNGGNETNNYYYNNDTYYVNGTDYLELISQVENLTAEVEALRLEIEEMQSSKYDVPENSSILIDRFSYRDFEIIKTGNIVTLEYRGAQAFPNLFNTSAPRNCTHQDYSWPSIIFSNVDGIKIMSLATTYALVHQDTGELWEQDGVEIIRECAILEDYQNTPYDTLNEYWSTIVITLPEEPVRVQIDGDYYTFY